MLWLVAVCNDDRLAVFGRVIREIVASPDKRRLLCSTAAQSVCVLYYLVNFNPIIIEL